MRGGLVRVAAGSYDRTVRTVPGCVRETEKKISTDLNGLRDSEKAYRARVSIPERSSVYKVLVARKDRSYQQRCSGRPLRFLRVAVTTARCSAIGVCYIISGVLKPYVFFFFARPAYPHEKHRKIVFARLVFREMILY